MPPQSNNPFGDESVDDPAKPNFDESIVGVPRESETAPPLPEVQKIEGPESAPEPIYHRQIQDAYQAPGEDLHRPHEEFDETGKRRFRFRRRFTWKKLVTWSAIAILIGGAWFFLFKARIQMAEEAAELKFKPAKARIPLSVQDGWQDLAFILRPGDRVVITASGEYFNSTIGLITAEGIEGSEGENKGSRAYDPIFPHGCLIARARAQPSKVFHIGTAGLLEAEAGGRLQVRVNDLDLIGNRGKLFVEARTFYKEPPNGETVRGTRDSEITPIKR